MNIAIKVREMSNVLEPDTIATTLSVPVELVKGILNGDIKDDEFESYNPFKTEIKVIETSNISQVREEIKLIDTKVSKINQKMNKPRTIFFYLKNLFSVVFDVIWILTIAIVMITTILTLYFVGKETGSFQHPILTEVALIIMDYAKLVFEFYS